MLGTGGQVILKNINFGSSLTISFIFKVLMEGSGHLFFLLYVRNLPFI